MSFVYLSLFLAVLIVLCSIIKKIFNFVKNLLYFLFFLIEKLILFTLKILLTLILNNLITIVILSIAYKFSNEFLEYMNTNNRWMI